MAVRPGATWPTWVKRMDATRDKLLRSTGITRPARVVGWIRGAQLDDVHTSNLIQSQAAGGMQGACDIQVADANNSILGQAVGIQGAANVQLVNANVSVAGRDSHIHTHVHHQEAGADLKSVLDDIDNFRKIQQETLAKATAGTVEWLFESQYFSIWWDKTGGFKILWGSGMPGAGKTILSSIAINEIERRAAKSPDSICVAYFYLRYSDHGNLTVRTVLEVLVKQSVERHRGLLPLFKEVYQQHIREGTRPTEEELLGLLQKFTNHMSITFYFLDALDEAPVDIQHDLVEKLASLNAQLFITSRPMKEVQPLFPEARYFDIVAQEQDLDLHIAKGLGSPRLRTLLAQRDISFRESVISAIKSKCGGMFLHASLQLAALQKCANVNSIMQTLERLPVKIEDVYHQTWERIMNQGPEQSTLARATLAWVVYAKRSLSVEELCHATAIHPVTHEFEEDRLIPPSTIMDLCHGLVTVDEQSQLVRLVHYTAKQPLEQLLTNFLPRPQLLLATVCTTRLMSRGFQDMTIRWIVELDRVLASDPLLIYAYEFWPYHVQDSLATHLTNTDAGISAFIAGCRAFPVKVPSFNSQKLYLELLGPFHIVAFYDLPIPLVGPHHGHNMNVPTKIQKSTPLALASVQGHYAAVQDFIYLPDLLVNAMDSDGLTALMYAAWRGCERTVNLLLAHRDIDINWANDNGLTALMVASKNGRESIVKLLLAHPDIEVNLSNKDGDTAFMLASKWGRTTTIKMLIAYPSINVNLANNSGHTALMIASEQGMTNTVELLVTYHNIEINLADEDGNTALILAFKGALRFKHQKYGLQFQSIIKLLLTHRGINVNLTINNRDTALILASTDMHALGGIFELLLAHPGIDVNLANNNGDTALMLAAYFGAFKLLLDHPSTRVNLRNSHGQTALMLLSQESNPNQLFVDLLLNHAHIDLNLANEDGDTALLLASKKGHTDIIKLMLAHPSTQVNLANNDGDTPLMVASKNGRESTAKLLLAHPDIAVNLANGRGFTALMAACDNRCDTIVKLLLAHPDIDRNLTDNTGLTALAYACRRCIEDIAQRPRTLQHCRQPAR